MAREQVLNEMASVRLGVSRRVRNTVDSVLALAEEYRFLGKNFTFSYNEDLDTQVNRMLIALSDGVMDDNDKAVMSAISYALDEQYGNLWESDEEREERDRQIFAYINRKQGDEDRQERYDMYSTRLRHLLEGWIAIGFANNLSQGQVRTQIFANFGNPFASELWREASRDGGYSADMIVSDTTGYGTGIPRNLIDGLTLTGQNSINEAFQYSILLAYSLKGNVIGYRVHRGSTYDCPYCDDLCIGVHPLTEMVLPAHPRCCCYTTPVLENENVEDY